MHDRVVRRANPPCHKGIEPCLRQASKNAAVPQVCKDTGSRRDRVSVVQQPGEHRAVFGKCRLLIGVMATRHHARATDVDIANR